MHAHWVCMYVSACGVYLCCMHMYLCVMCVCTLCGGVCCMYMGMCHCIVLWFLAAGFQPKLLTTLLFYRMAAPECLPLILEPESRFFTDPVLVLDFQSLYPSIIIAHNYCYSTCLGKMKHLFRYEHFLIAPCIVFFWLASSSYLIKQKLSCTVHYLWIYYLTECIKQVSFLYSTVGEKIFLLVLCHILFLMTHWRLVSLCYLPCLWKDKLLCPFHSWCLIKSPYLLLVLCLWSLQ